MPVTHLVVTPLPAGRSGNTLSLSVHLSPRLRAKGTLADYPNIADWGTFVTAAPALQFQPLINGAVRPGVTTTVVSPPVDPNAWRALFGQPSKVPVNAFTFADRSRINLAAIDSGELSEAIMQMLKRAAALGPTHPQAAELLATVGALGGSLDAAEDYFGQVGDGQQPASPSIEFHDQLGPLHAHPHLLRVLGLVYDLTITVPAAGGAINEIAVRTNWAAKMGLTPRDEATMRVRVDAGFLAVVRQPEYRTTDWLRLGGPKYAVAQLDLINAVQQIGQLTTALAGADGPDAPVAVPALNEGGLSVICGDLGDVLKDRLTRQRRIEREMDAWFSGAPNTRPPLLSAEDITLGVRADVLDLDAAAVTYRSLHDRQAPGGYVFPRDKALKVIPPGDEGWSVIALSTDGGELRRPQSTNVTYSQEGQPTEDKVEELDLTAWRVDDHLISWGGWSLSTPRVGASSTGTGGAGPRQPNTPRPGASAQLIADYAHVNGTLPKLRYGHRYQFRGRCVDLAGNGPALSDSPPNEGESAEVDFGRLTPISPPLAVRRASRPDPGVGDLAEVLVIRSELEQSDAGTAPADRLLFPPRTSQSRVERHDLPGGGNLASAYDQLAERDAVSLADQTIVDPETGELVAGEALVDGQVTAGPLRPAIGYLSDPMAGSVAGIGLPGGDPAVPALIGFGRWPDVRAVQLELRAGTRPPVISSRDRRLTVRLPKGTVAAAELACAPPPNRLAQMAFAHGLDAAATDDALAGLNRVLSGRRTVRFVHAVRLTLAPPSFGEMSGARTEVGQTDVVIAGTLGLHRATTEHIVLRSRWVDPIDDPAQPAPTEQVSKRIVADRQIAEAGEATTELLPDVRLELGDTKRRRVTLIADSFCRFSRYFTERVDFVSGRAGTAVPLNTNGVAPPTVTVTRLDSGEPLARGVHFTVDRIGGELTILDTTTVPQGTPCRAEFIPLPVSRRSLEAPPGGRQFSFDVPASTAPALPAVITALPAFARTISVTANRISVVHDGQVIRLHLARPWFSTGEGELLGVAVESTSRTRWGRDPLVAGDGAVDAPTLAAFGRAVDSAAAVDGTFDVAGHQVSFDADRELWTADVAIGAQAGYRPFVTLHVCRFQPLAVDGQHVSGTVEIDTLRLGASREVIVTKLSGGRVRVRMNGPDNVNVVSVTLQQADPAIADPDLRWQDVSTTVLARAGSTAAARHDGIVDISAPGAERRLLIEDAEPASVESGGALVASSVVAYRELVEIPAEW